MKRRVAGGLRKQTAGHGLARILSYSASKSALYFLLKAAYCGFIDAHGEFASADCDGAGDCDITQLVSDIQQVADVVHPFQDGTQPVMDVEHQVSDASNDEDTARDYHAIAPYSAPTVIVGICGAIVVIAILAIGVCKRKTDASAL
jgi:hypothetical protein